MEINITWNVCRVCLQEHDVAANSSTERNTFQINLDMAKEILEMTGVVIKPNDSLPQKICRKCSQVLKQAVNFRTTCRSSDIYLQNILEKAKSTTSLFKLDKPSKIVFEDIAEEPTEDIFCEEHLLEDCDHELKRKHVDNPEDIKTSQKKRKEHSTTVLSDEEKSFMKTNSDNDDAPEMITSEMNLLSKSHEGEFSKSNVDFGSMFLNSESDVQPSIGSKESSKNVTFSETEPNKHNNTLKKEVESNDFLQYKTLEVDLDSSEENAQDEMMETNKLSSVDITNNDEIQELFLIFSDNVMLKKNNEVPKHAKDDTIMVENMAEMDDNIDENLGEEENFDDLVCSESNTLDPIDSIDEEQSKYDLDEIIKCEGISRETTPNNENENFYQQDDSIERTIVQYKILQEEENMTEYDKNEEDAFVMKSDKPKMINNFCDICGNLFNSRSLLKHHMRTHRNERNYECEMCFKRFTAACNLTTHMRTHTGEKPFVCHFCHRRFSDKSTHVKHERSHTGERPYSCTICQKAFTLSSSLKAHEKVHTGEKPFNCYTCVKSFKLPHQLKAHLSTNAHKIRLEEEFIPPHE